MLESPTGGDRGLLVHVDLKNLQFKADTHEFCDLALAAGVQVIIQIKSTRKAPSAKYLIGSGKVLEIQKIISEAAITVVLFNYELTPGQQRNLERTLQCRVLDRTTLILDIFAQRARTFEGKLQVELAQLQYLASRLVRGWTHLERQKGGIGLRGPGETQLEVDKRLIRHRIRYISQRLEKVRSQRQISRRARDRASIPTVAIVGYTNAGKSTLFNALTGAETFAANQLFATLDPTLRAITLPEIGKVVLSDTVGFIKDLPHNLIEAFKATLEEASEANLVLHVIDRSNPDWRDQRIQVEAVLEQIGALDIPRIEVFNKADLVSEYVDLQDAYTENNDAKCFWVSAKNNSGLTTLLSAIKRQLTHMQVVLQIKLPPSEGALRAKLFATGALVQETIDEQGYWALDISMPQVKWLQLQHHEKRIVDYLRPKLLDSE